MAVFEIEVKQEFSDIITGETHRIGSIFTTDDAGRVADIVARNIGKLQSATLREQTGNDIIIYQSCPYAIGGIETALRAISQAFPTKPITFLFSSYLQGGEKQLLELAKNHNVIVDDGQKTYKADVVLFMNHQDACKMLDRIEARKYYQQFHTDYENLTKIDYWKDFRPEFSEKIDAFLSVSKRVKESLKTMYGVDSTIVPNIVPEPSKRLVFICMSRGTKEKGLERLLSFSERLRRAGKDFVIYLCGGGGQSSEYQRLRAEGRIVNVEASMYNEALYKCADYVLITSHNEAYCYAAHEALARAVPIIGYKGVPVIEELASGGHGYIIDDSLTDEDIDNIFNKKPEFKAQKFGVAPIWHRVLGGKL